METVRASVYWPGPDLDVLRLFVEPSRWPWIAALEGDDPEVAVLREVDEEERETGRISGVEIVGFLDFDRWEALPDLPLLWQLPDEKPLPLPALLKRGQQRFRRQALRAAG